MTEASFIQLCETLSDHLVLQGLLIAVGTCFLEDAARCGVGLLVAIGHIGWWLAFVSMTVGGMAGDLGLYLIGRYATLFLIKRRWVDKKRLIWMEGYFRNHAAKTVLFSRFLPGARTVAFSAAGVIRYPLPRFLLLLFVAAVAQSLLFLKLGTYIGSHILPYLEGRRARLSVIAVIVLLGILVHQLLSRRRSRRERATAERALTETGNVPDQTA